MTNCLELVRPFATLAAEEGYENFQVFGGIGSHALTLASTEIHPDERLVTVSEEVMLAQRRVDGNLRDFDCLILDTDQSVVDGLEALAKKTIGKELELSFFGLRSLDQLTKQAKRPASSAAKVWVSDRYVTMADGEVALAQKALYPFAVDMDPALLETWHLQINGDRPLPIPHPGVTILNYLTRSISGLRPKDATKVEKLSCNIIGKAPEVLDWVVDGPGQSQIEFARILHSLGNSSAPERRLRLAGHIDIATYSAQELRDHEAFMPGADDPNANSILRAAQIKSKVVGFFEKHDQVVTMWQKYVEPRIDIITKNKG